MSRLITEHKRRGRIRQAPYRRHRFPRKYNPAEVMLLAKTDELHWCLSRPATKKIMERKCEVYGHIEFENISRISVAHLHNLRRSNVYQGITRRDTRTKPVVSRIGERSKLGAKGKLGYILSLDMIRQGDMNGKAPFGKLKELRS